MTPEQKPITGKEDKTGLSLPHQALIDFYHAFNSGNLGEMSRNWAQSEHISMDNPVGGIKRGWNEIKELYDRIFNGPVPPQPIREKTFFVFFQNCLREFNLLWSN